MPRIMIDMDEVIVPSYGDGFLYLVNEFFNTDYQKEDFDGIYYLQSIIPKEHKEEFFKWFFTKNMYDYCEIYPHAYEVIEQLYKSSLYDVLIGTSYIMPNWEKECGILLWQKHNFLMDNLPFLSPGNYAFVVNKAVLNCEIKIDDYLNNLRDTQRKILFRAYHNQGLSKELLKSQGIELAHDWLEIKKLLLK